MVTKEEKEMFRKSKTESEKEDPKSILNDFWQDVAETEKRFEDVIDAGIRKCIASFDNGGGCVPLFVEFKTERLAQFAALVRIIDKYIDNGFKIYPVNYMMSDLYHEFKYNSLSQKSKFQRSEMTIEEMKKRNDDLVKAFTDVANFDIEIGYVSDPLRWLSCTKKITVKDIVKGEPMKLIDVKYIGRLQEGCFLEFTI